MSGNKFARFSYGEESENFSALADKREDDDLMFRDYMDRHDIGFERGTLYGTRLA